MRKKKDFYNVVIYLFLLCKLYNKIHIIVLLNIYFFYLHRVSEKELEVNGAIDQSAAYINHGLSVSVDSIQTPLAFRGSDDFIRKYLFKQYYFNINYLTIFTI